MLIDSHCHVLRSEYENPDEIIKEVLENGVDKLIINGYDLKSSKEAYALSIKYKNVYSAVGIGPENIECFSEEVIKKFEKMIKSGMVSAIGEIGLDYYWTKVNKEQQIEVFKNMLSLAEKYNLPVIIHSRDAIEDTYNILKTYNVTGILHCFSGSVESAKRFIELGYLIGIAGVVTFKNAKKIVEVVKEINLSDISIETDSPYLSPEPYRGKQNKPTYIKYIAEKIAKIKGVSIKDVIDITGRNVVSKFDL